MRNVKLRLKIDVVEVITYTCNKCGVLCPESQHHVHRISGGFGSTYPGDCVNLEYVLCDDCERTFVESLLLPPTQTDHWGVPQEYEATLVDANTVHVVSPTYSDPDVPCGVYRHYKGGLYHVYGIDEIDGDDVVIYRSIKTGKVWARPLTQWHERVDGDKLRFEPLTEHLHHVSDESQRGTQEE